MYVTFQVFRLYLVSSTDFIFYLLLLAIFQLSEVGPVWVRNMFNFLNKHIWSKYPSPFSIEFCTYRNRPQDQWEWNQIFSLLPGPIIVLNGIQIEKVLQYHQNRSTKLRYGCQMELLDLVLRNWNNLFVTLIST